MSRSIFRSQAHRKGERDIDVVILLAALTVVILSVVLWGVPSGLPG